jgi:putative transposase
MPRIARIVATHAPYHVTQRGNNRQDIFFTNDDRKRYLEWLSIYSSRFQFDLVAYCLMTNHVHLIGIPRNANSMSKTIQTVHMRHTQSVNHQNNRMGHLWHSRYYSVALDDSHLWQAVRYVEQNPVRIGIVRNAEEYVWSSAAYHCGLRGDFVVKKNPRFDGLFDGWVDILHEVPDEEIVKKIRDCTNRGIPYGDDGFRRKISERVGREIADRRRGRPRNPHG